MRTALYSNPSPGEVDDWFAKHGRGGTPQVGIAVLVAYLEGWYVNPDARRTGLGAHLLEAAESWVLEHGFSELASDTELGNDISLPAHVALGFEEVGRQICFRKRLR